MVKKPITFYPTEEVEIWLKNFSSGDKSRRINDALKSEIQRGSSRSRFDLPLNFYQMQTLMRTLKREHQSWFDSLDDDPENQEGFSELSDLLTYIETFLK